jgi:Tfp pilus assembly pilus retraction ATPase PilT
MDTSLIPSKPGQICKIISQIPDNEPEEVFIVSEDPADFENDDEIMVVNLKELQRNIRQPENAERINIRKDQLVVVGEDLTSYVKSWNNGDRV